MGWHTSAVWLDSGRTASQVSFHYQRFRKRPTPPPIKTATTTRMITSGMIGASACHTSCAAIDPRMITTNNTMSLDSTIDLPVVYRRTQIVADPEFTWCPLPCRFLHGNLSIPINVLNSHVSPA